MIRAVGESELEDSHRPTTLSIVRKISLLLLVVPVVCFALRPDGNWPARLIDAVASPDGSVFAAIHREEVNNPEIWRLDQNLRGGERVAQLLCEPEQFVAGADGEALVVIGEGQLMGFSTSSATRKWNRVFKMQATVTLLDGGDYFLLVEPGGKSVRVFDVRSGDELNADEWGWSGATSPLRIVERLYYRSPFFVIEGLEGGQQVAEWTGARLEQLTGAEAVEAEDYVRSGVGAEETATWDFVHRRARESSEKRTLPDGNHLQVSKSWQVPSELRIVTFPGKDLIRRKVFGRGISSYGGWFFALPIISVCFSLLLAIDGSSTGHPRRIYIDAVILWLFGALPYVAWQAELLPDHVRELQPLRLLPMLLAWLACFAFLLLVGTNRRLYTWASILVGSGFVFFLPAIALALGCRRFGFESPIQIRDRSIGENSERRIQFGIADVMLGTAAIAIFMAFGRTILDWMIAGFGYAVVLLFGLPALKNRVLAWGWLAVTAFASCRCMLTPRPQDFVLYTFPWMVLMVFALIAIYRYRVGGHEVEPEPDLGTAIVD